MVVIGTSTLCTARQLWRAPSAGRRSGRTRGTPLPSPRVGLPAHPYRVIDRDSGAQSRRTAGRLEDRVEGAPLADGIVLLAQRRERFGVILLRLLGPGAAPQLDAELLATVRERLRVGYGPR